MSGNSSASELLPFCQSVALARLVSIAVLGTRLAVQLPVSVLVLALCYRQHGRRSAAAMSPLDVFTLHQAVIHLVTAAATAIFFCIQHTGQAALVRVSLYVSSIAFPGELFLHALTGVERYVAVVHPLAYRALRRADGVRVRKVSVAGVWLLCSAWVAAVHLYYPHLPYVPFFCLLAVTLAVVSFCGLAVLRALIGPGPGGVGGDNQVKVRAFHTISAVVAVQLLYLLAVAACLAMETSRLLGYRAGCIVLTSVNWLALLSGSVLPLLYLHRAGTLSRRRPARGRGGGVG